MKDIVRRQIAAAQALAAVPKYKERARVQMLSWAMGRAYHEPINDECCPDFSCCVPSMFTTDSAERWRQYRGSYQRGKGAGTGGATPPTRANPFDILGPFQRGHIAADAMSTKPSTNPDSDQNGSHK